MTFQHATFWQRTFFHGEIFIRGFSGGFFLDFFSRVLFTVGFFSGGKYLWPPSGHRFSVPKNSPELISHYLNQISYYQGQSTSKVTVYIFWNILHYTAKLWNLQLYHTDGRKTRKKKSLLGRKSVFAQRKTWSNVFFETGLTLNENIVKFLLLEMWLVFFLNTSV